MHHERAITIDNEGRSIRRCHHLGDLTAIERANDRPRIMRRGNARQQLGNTTVTLADDRRTRSLEDATLLSGDRIDRGPEPLRVIEGDRRDYGGTRVDNVRRVEPPA